MSDNKYWKYTPFPRYISPEKVIEKYREIMNETGTIPSAQKVAKELGIINPATGKLVTRQAIHLAMSHHPEGRKILDMRVRRNLVPLVLDVCEEWVKKIGISEYELITREELSQDTVLRRIIYVDDAPFSILRRAYFVNLPSYDKNGNFVTFVRYAVRLIHKWRRGNERAKDGWADDAASGYHDKYDDFRFFNQEREKLKKKGESVKGY